MRSNRRIEGYRTMALHGGDETRFCRANKGTWAAKFPAVRGSIASLDVQDANTDRETAMDEKALGGLAFAKFGYKQILIEIVAVF